MAKERKTSKTKQMLIDNYEKQKAERMRKGYQESSEVFSVAKANIMGFVTSLPIARILLLLWILAERGPTWTTELNDVLGLPAVLVTACIDEGLRGVGWCLGTKKKWKSIYIGMMWSSLTPYCHCKEPLEPGKYLIGCLLPGTLLGLGIYLAAFLTGSNVLL